MANLGSVNRCPTPKQPSNPPATINYRVRTKNVIVDKRIAKTSLCTGPVVHVAEEVVGGGVVGANVGNGVGDGGSVGACVFGIRGGKMDTIIGADWVGWRSTGARAVVVGMGVLGRGRMGGKTAIGWGLLSPWVGDVVVGDVVVGDCVVGDGVVGNSVVGDCVVGDGVVGDGVVGDCVVGDGVVGDCVVGGKVGKGVTRVVGRGVTGMAVAVPGTHPHEAVRAGTTGQKSC